MRQYINLIEQFLLEDFDTGRFLERMQGVMELIRRGATEGERGAAKSAFDRMIERARIEVARMREPNSRVTRNQIDRFTQALERLTSTSTKTEPPKAKPQPPPAIPKFRVGQWVVYAADSSVGKITRVMSFSIQNTFLYVVAFDTVPTQKSIDERFLRVATQDEIDATLAKRAKTTQSSSDKKTSSSDDTKSQNTDLDIRLMARYVNAAENSNKVYGVVTKNGKHYTFWGGYQKALKVKRYAANTEALAQFQAKVRKGYKAMPPDAIDSNRDWVTRALKTEFARIGESRYRKGPTLNEAPFGRRGVNDAEVDQARKYPSAEAYADENNPVGRTNTDPPRIQQLWQQEQNQLIAKWNRWHDLGESQNNKHHYKAQDKERYSMNYG